MASITKQTVGNNTYLYESHSFRDDKGRPRNRKIKIGKIDRNTGSARYTPEYIDRMREAGTPVELPLAEGLEEHVSKALDSLKTYGLFYFLKKAAEKIKLIEILEQTFPAYWEEIFTLCAYLIASDKPLMYMEDWIGEHESCAAGKMSSQRLSELLGAFGQEERNGFFKAWCARNISDEYMAVDITSVSSYSRLIPECERGYNRDGEDLDHINFCLLFGERTQLPIYQTVYSGSIGDQATLKATLAEVEAVSGGKKLVLVADKGFYSVKNVEMMIEKHKGSEFLLAVPFANKWTVELIREERDSIDRIANLIQTSGSPARGVIREIDFAGTPLNAHVLFNPERSLDDRNHWYGYVAWLKELAEAGKDTVAHRKDIEKYLEVRAGKDRKKKATVREDVLERKLETAGWFVLLGNGKMTAQQAYDIYRKKDVVEKAFMKYKQQLGLKRLRIHSETRMRNKMFAAFVALTLVSSIHKVMKEKGLYRKMTMEKMFITLAKLKKVTVNGRDILRPLTKEQRDIFIAFGIPRPCVG
ncbi:MAG: transposase [Treponema sp.]|nr:transposase [Treponema sp.]